jgi:hypothetical protein
VSLAWLNPRRWSAGLWGVALLCAVVVPVLVHIAGPHHSHWAGVGAQGWWGGLVVPWSARLQAMMGVLTVAGWAAWAGPEMPLRRHALAAGAVAGLTGAAVSLLAAAPPWVWLFRIGAAAPSTIMGHMVWVGLAVTTSGVVAGSTGALGLGALAALLGGLSGGTIVWLGWPA